jgi:ABC-2 type transport system permease protein
MSAVTVTHAPEATHARPGHYKFSGLLRSEWTKLRTVRSTMWTLGLTIFLGLVIAVIYEATIQAHWARMTPAKRAAFDVIGSTQIGVFFAQFVIGVLGVLVLSGEYGTGTIRAVFCAAPGRLRVLTAKAIVFGVVALITAEITSFGSFLLGEALLTAPAPHATLGTPGALRAATGSGLYICAMGLFALGIATLIRHTAGAISAFAGILLVLPLIVSQLPTSLDNDITRFEPTRIGAALVSGPPLGNSFSPWVGLLILCGYTAVLFIVGGVLLVKRDA